MVLQFKVKGLKKLEKKYSPKVVNKYINQGIKRATIFLQGEIKKNTPVGVRGFLRTGFKVKFRNLRGVIFNIRKYAIYVHEGTQPHRVGIRHLERWARVKGVNVYAVQRAIARKGTKPNRFIFRTVEVQEKQVVKQFEKSIIDLTNL